MSRDEQHLKLLSIFHYIAGGLCALFSCVFILHFVIGVLALTKPELFEGDEALPAFFGWIFVAAGAIPILVGWTIGSLMIAAGRSLAKRTRYMFCFVIAAISCMFVPFGTVLGVFTIIVLSRESVRALFDNKMQTAQPFAQTPPPPPPPVDVRQDQL
jgi:hypothetical protein